MTSPTIITQLRQAITDLRAHRIEQAEAALFNVIHRSEPETLLWTAVLFAVNWISPCNLPSRAVEVLERAVR